MKDTIITFKDGSSLELSEESYDKLHKKANEIATYNDIFKNGNIKCIDNRCDIYSTSFRQHQDNLDKLSNIARYYNADWKIKYGQTMYYVGVKWGTNSNKWVIEVRDHYTIVTSTVYFKNRDDAYKAIELLGEKAIKSAISMYL